MTKPLTLDEARKLGLIRKPKKRKPPVLLIAPHARLDLVARVIELRVPVKLESEANRRGHWRTHDARRKKQREAVSALWRSFPTWTRVPIGARFVVTITRIAPRQLDTDNLATSAKAVRDELAAWLGVSDGPKGPVEWRYGQKSEGKAYGVLVEVTW